MIISNDLLVSIERKDKIPLNRQIYEQILGKIASGTLRPGEPIPPSRVLAQELNVSRTVIVQAYELLQAEGYIEMRRGSGTFITDINETERRKTFPHADTDFRTIKLESGSLNRAKRLPDIPSPAELTPARYDFKHGIPALDLFPQSSWRNFIIRAYDNANSRTLGYGPAEGSEYLRSQILRLLRHSRGIVCDTEHLIVTTGATQAIDLVARVLLKSGGTAIVEDPCHPVLRKMFEGCGADILPVRVDDEGVVVSELNAQFHPRRDVKLICVTPSHQFPSGVVMSLERKRELIACAERYGAYILEDDYDSEFCHGGKRINSLRGICDRDNVIYVGTFSKSLFPALRIGYMVLPDNLVEPVLAMKWITDRLTPTIEQEALAAFITNGNFARHISKMRRLYSGRRAVLVKALNDFFGPRVEIGGIAAGLHILIKLDSSATEQTIAEQAKACHAGIYPASPYYISCLPERPTFILGYGNISEKQIRAGVEQIHTGETFARRLDR